jgi:uncharacterized protein DUF1236
MKNTRNTLLMSVAAAALIVGAGVTYAQAPSPAPAAQQSAPAEKTAPVLERKGAAKTQAPDARIKSGQVDEKSGRKGDRAQGAQETTKDGMTSKSRSSETKSPSKTSSEMKADPKTRTEMKADPKSSDRASEKAVPKNTDRASEKAGDAKAGTTGQGAAGASANLSTEQRATFRTAIKRQNVQPASNVKFSISVGARVPRTVHFYPVPVELVRTYPQWRGYDYFLVGDQIVVVNPRTHEIVAVLEA